jgi:hypothetical protein
MDADVNDLRIPRLESCEVSKNSLFSNPSVASKEVQNTNQVLDSIKPKWIPDWVKRTKALYLYPEITVDFLLMIGYPSSDLYAVKLPHNRRGWMGSQLYGGFWSIRVSDGGNGSRVSSFIKEDVGKKYWNYSCYDRRTRRKDRYVQEFDEILFFERIPPENVELIGQWDQGIFRPNDSFIKYVKDEYKEEYMKIFGTNSL